MEIHSGILYEGKRYYAVLRGDTSYVIRKDKLNETDWKYHCLCVYSNPKLPWFKRGRRKSMAELAQEAVEWVQEYDSIIETHGYLNGDK